MAKPRAQKRSPVSPPHEPRRTRPFVWAPIVVVLAGLAAYANSLTGPFLFDDRQAIVENRSIRQLWPIGAVWHPPVHIALTGRPLVNLSFAVNYALGGLGVNGYHAANIAVHIMAALALLGLLRRTLALTPFLRDEGGGATDLLALLCTVVWVVHPLNTETVDYLTQRTESMMGLFYLVTLYASIRALQPGRAGRWEILAGLAALAGVTAKETTITLPVVLVLWDRIFAFGTFRAAWAQRRRLYVAVSACWLLFLGETAYFGSTGFQEQLSPWMYLLNQGPIIARYLRLALWPRGLVFDYGVMQTVALGEAWPSLALLLVLFAVTLVALVRRPRFGFWAAWMFITLAPASSVIPIPTEVGGERRMYLPLIGVIVLVVMLAWTLFRRLASGTLRRNLGWMLASATVLGLAAATIQRNLDYKTGLSIWQTVLDRRPHARAHEHLAMYLRDAGRIDEAIAHLRTAATGSPNARHALASALLEQADVTGAIAEFREFVRLRPDDPQIIVAREEFGAALLRAGDAEGAADQFRAIVSIAPDYPRGHLGLADALVRANDLDGAIAQYRDVLRVQPNNLTALFNLGMVLSSRGRLDEAIEMLRRAVQVGPRDINARRQLLHLLLGQRKFSELEAEARTVLSMNPDDAEAHNLLGVALASQQRLTAASEQFAEVLRLNPTHQDARANLARATEALRHLPAAR